MNKAGTYMVEEERLIWQLLDHVPDPEIPVLSVNDLGIIRDLRIIHPARSIEITVTPTYSGCPAMDVIRMSIRMTLLQRGYQEINILTVLAPAWTTEWISEAGKQKLKAYGIAPPGRDKSGGALFEEAEPIQCPQCNSFNTGPISEFGSTACKALHRCNDCGEPFDYFKCH